MQNSTLFYRPVKSPVFFEIFIGLVFLVEHERRTAAVTA